MSKQEGKQMFSCEMCDNALRGYEVTTTDLEKSEVCSDCLEILESAGLVITASRFVGLKD